MNNEWKKGTIEGQPMTGFSFMCSTIVNDIAVSATVYCYPNLNEFGNNKIAAVSVFWQCDKQRITDGVFHSVMDDIGEIIKNDAHRLFDYKLSNAFKLMMSQHFYCDKLPNIQQFTFGDYTIQ